MMAQPPPLSHMAPIISLRHVARARPRGRFFLDTCKDEATIDAYKSALDSAARAAGARLVDITSSRLETLPTGNMGRPSFTSYSAQR